jgi:signal peptidase
MLIASAEEETPVVPEPREQVWKFAAGLIGRAWLWFIAGCLIVTLLPMVFGWRPYVVESGSMSPRLKVGDVVVAAPDQNPQELLGRITVFTDPARPETVKTHRVIQLAPDGTLVTKGDANVTADPVHLQLAEVRGLGRLLVRFSGLPLIWVQTGQWLWLLLFLASVLLAAIVVSRDQADDDEDEREEGESDDDDPGARAHPPRQQGDVAALTG